MAATIRRALKPVWPFCLNEDSPVAQGLVGWWSPDAVDSDQLLDLSGLRQNNLTLANAPLRVAGPDGGAALQFLSASSQSADGTTPIADPSVSGCTVAGWYLSFTNSANLPFFSLADSSNATHRIQLRAAVTSSVGGRLNIIGSSSQISDATFGLTAYAWNFFVGGVHKTPTTTGWAFNGRDSTNTAATDYSGLTGLNTVSIGRIKNSSSTYYNGAVGDCFVWNRLLSPAERYYLYDSVTRWGLRYQIGKTKWFFNVQAAAPGTSGLLLRRRRMAVGGNAA